MGCILPPESHCAWPSLPALNGREREAEIRAAGVSQKVMTMFPISSSTISSLSILKRTSEMFDLTQKRVAWEIRLFLRG